MTVFAMAGAGVLIYLAFVALMLFALYWVIRLAVRHALRDARGEAGPAANGPWLPGGRP